MLVEGHTDTVFNPRVLIFQTADWRAKSRQPGSKRRRLCSTPVHSITVCIPVQGIRVRRGANPAFQLAPPAIIRYGEVMPTVHREAGAVFYFYAEEGSELTHVHVDKGDGTAKFWLNPLRLAWTEDLKAGEVRQIMKIAEQQQNKLLEAWNEFFTSES